MRGRICDSQQVVCPTKSTCSSPCLPADQVHVCEGSELMCTEPYCSDLTVTFTCQPSQPCSLRCAGGTACANSTLVPNGASSVSVTCIGDSACENLVIMADQMPINIDCATSVPAVPATTDSTPASTHSPTSQPTFPTRSPISSATESATPCPHEIFWIEVLSIILLFLCTIASCSICSILCNCVIDLCIRRAVFGTRDRSDRRRGSDEESESTYDDDLEEARRKIDARVRRRHRRKMKNVVREDEPGDANDEKADTVTSTMPMEGDVILKHMERWQNRNSAVSAESPTKVLTMPASTSSHCPTIDEHSDASVLSGRPTKRDDGASALNKALRNLRQ